MYMYTYLEMMVQTYKMMAHDSGVDFDFSCALFPLISGNHDLSLLFPAMLFSQITAQTHRTTAYDSGVIEFEK